MGDMRDRGPNGNLFEQKEIEVLQETERMEALYREQFGISVEESMPGQSGWLEESACSTVEVRRSAAQAAINAARSSNSRGGRRELQRLQPDPDMHINQAKVIHVDFTRQGGE